MNSMNWKNIICLHIKLLCNGKCIYSNVLIKFKEFVYIYNFTCFELIRMDLKSHWKCRNKIQRICIYYNFTYFELIRMDLKSHRKCRNQKTFSIFCIRLTSMKNCKRQIQWIGQIFFVSTFVQYESPFPLDLKIKLP